MSPGLSTRVPLLSNPHRVPLQSVDPSRPCGGRMKGFGLLHLIEHAHQMYGPESLTGWAEALPAPLKQYSKTAGLTSVGWLPLELYFSAIEHLIKTQHAGDVRKAIDFGHAMATRDIGAFFRAAMKFATAPTVFSLSGRFWRTYFDFGSLVMTNKAPPTADAELRDWPLMAEVAYYELAGSFVAWLEASKASNVRLTRLELASPALLSLRIEWS